MFKKFLDAINNSEKNIIKNIVNQADRLANYIVHIDETKKDVMIKELTKNLNNQTELIKQLINNKFEDDNAKYDTVVLIPYRGKPSVFKDGKRISTDKANSFTVNWATDSKTEVNVYNE